PGATRARRRPHHPPLRPRRAAPRPGAGLHPRRVPHCRRRRAFHGISRGGDGMTAKARTPVALTAWTELNDRQQGTLRAIYLIDQRNEETRRREAARGRFDGRPAVEWRRIDFAHDPSDRRLVGLTELQSQLELHGWDNQGNGSTMAALASRGLITRNIRGTAFGVMHTVALTRAGRAAARAGISLDTGAKPKVGLSERAWEVLALVSAADLRGQPPP